MSRVLDDADFWRSSPPSHFLSGDTAMSFNKAAFPVDSQVMNGSEEEDFFAELNRRLTLSESRNVTPVDLRQPSEVPKAFGGSPQSILGGIGSWSGRSSNESHQSPVQGPSPPDTPYEAEYDTVGLVQAVSGEVERLKMDAESPFKPDVNHMDSVHSLKASFLAEQNYLAAARRAYRAALLLEQHLHNLKTMSAHVQQHQNRVSSKTNFQAAPIQRKESAGTGVFLPRRYDASQDVPPRMRAVTTNAIVPDKVVQALNMSIEGIKTRSQPHYSAYAASMSHKDYEALMARRNAFLGDQQRSVARADEFAKKNIELCLPHEWSY